MVTVFQFLLLGVVLLWLLCNKTTLSRDGHVTPKKVKEVVKSSIDGTDKPSVKPHPPINGIHPVPHIVNGSGLLSATGGQLLGATGGQQTLESLSDESLHTEVCFHGNNSKMS